MKHSLFLVSIYAAALAGSAAPSPAAVPAGETVVVDLSSAAKTRWDFKPEGGDWKPIQVPAGGWRAQGFKCDAGTYRATITIPAEAKGNMVRVRFAAVNFGADVLVGKTESSLTKVASHVDGWVPFTADLTSQVAPGEKALLIVEVKGRRKFMVNGKYTVPEGATWYEGLEEGILRGITLELVPPVHIDDVFAKTSLAPDLLQPQVTVANNTNKAVNVVVAAALASADRTSFSYPQITHVTAEIPAGGSRSVDLGKIAWSLGAKSYWWPNVPYRANYQAQLHLLNVTLQVNGQVTHRFQQRFGFRQFQAQGNHYELNGIHCNLRGDNQQEANFGTDAYGVKPGFGPPSAQNAGWPLAVDNLLRLNFNVMRIHQIPATPYMLDVCDEKGLMLVEESPLRGSEGGEDYANGRDNMLNMDRELVLRDRNHPAVVIWSAANEWTDPIPDAVKAILELDDTRPIIADGVGDFNPKYINMQHYCDGMPGLPKNGGSFRTDRPYGETEAVWPADNTWRGFAWMATGTRLRRMKGNADIRNYVLNNAWPNYVPGEGPETEILERKVKNMGPDLEMHASLADPWNHPLIRLMQECYHPLTACDIEFDRANARSNVKGEWPIVKPWIPAGAHVVRKLAVFNDEFSGEDVTLRWQVRAGSKTGTQLAKGEANVHIPLGEFATQEIAFDSPKDPGEVVLLFSVLKNGQERFAQDQTSFTVANGDVSQLTDGDYHLLAMHSGLAAGVSDGSDREGAPVVQANPGNDPAQIWHLKKIGSDDFTLTNKKTGLVLAIKDGSAANDTRAVQEKASDQQHQVWHITVSDTGGLTLTNKKTGKVLDVYGRAMDAGARIVQWDGNGGENQQWELKP